MALLVGPAPDVEVVSVSLSDGAARRVARKANLSTQQLSLNVGRGRPVSSRLLASRREKPSHRRAPMCNGRPVPGECVELETETVDLEMCCSAEIHRVISVRQFVPEVESSEMPVPTLLTSSASPQSSSSLFLLPTFIPPARVVSPTRTISSSVRVSSHSAQTMRASQAAASAHHALPARLPTPDTIAVQLPRLLEVPLPDDTFVLPTRVPSTSSHCDILASSCEPLVDEVLPSANAHFYVERLRVITGDTPACKVCSGTFAAKQLRLGYVRCGVNRLTGDNGADENLARSDVHWLHVPDCLHAGDFNIRLEEDIVAFSPTVSTEDRQQVLAILSMPSASGAAPDAPRIFPLPWRYALACLPGREHQWFSCTVSRPSASPEVNQEEPTTGPSAASSAARRAIAYGARLHRGRLAALRPAPAVLTRERRSWQTSASDRTTPRSVTASEASTNSRNGQPEVSGQAAASTPSGARKRSTAAVELLLRHWAPSRRLLKQSEDPCVICREPMLIGERVRRLPCLHIFHAVCLERWLRVKARCPLDNMKVSDMIAEQEWMSCSNRMNNDGARERSRSRRRSIASAS